MEQAVENDLGGIRVGVGKVFLAASARKLARAIDARGDDEAPSALAKAVDSLYKVMMALTAKEGDSPDDRRQLEQAIGTPDAGSPAVSPALRYPPETGKAHRRARNRPDRTGPRSE